MELVMPNNYVLMNDDEMTYMEGGYTSTSYGTAKNLKLLAQSNMVTWGGLAANYTIAAAVAAGSGVGLAGGAVAGLGAVVFSNNASKYASSFTYFSNLSQTSTKKYFMKTTSFLGVITGVSRGAA